jgi:hypothetical protein
MNLANLVVDLKNMIGPAGKGSEVGDPGLKTWINDAYLMQTAAIIDVMPDYFTKKATTSSISGQQEYSLPSDFEKMVLCKASYDGTNYTRVVPLNNIGQATDLTNTNSQMYHQDQPFYYIYGTNFGILPTFDTTLSGNIQIWYSYTPTELSDDADEPVVPSRFQSILKYWGYANYLDQNDEHTAAERMRQRFEASLERLVQQLSDRQPDMPKTVEVYDNGSFYYDE